MKLSSFAQQYGEFNDLKKREEAKKPPIVIGLVGGYALKDAPSLNSIFFKELPDVPELIGFQNKKQTETAFKDIGVVYLDINYVRLFRNYIIACDEQQIQDLQTEFDNTLKQRLNAAALQHLFKNAFNYNEGEKCPGCALCTQAVIDDTHVESFRQIIDNDILHHCLVNQNQFIDEQAIVLVLPVHSQFYQRCNKIIFLQDSPSTRDSFLNSFPIEAKKQFIEHEGKMRMPHTININIEGKTTTEVVELIKPHLDI